MGRGRMEEGGRSHQINPAGSRSAGAAHLRIASCQISTGPRSRRAPERGRAGAGASPKIRGCLGPVLGRGSGHEGSLPALPGGANPGPRSPSRPGDEGTSAGTWHHPARGQPCSITLWFLGLFYLFIYFFNYFFPRDPRVEVATGAPGVMGGGPVGTQPPGLPKEGLRPALVHAAVPRTGMQPAGF